MRDLVFEFLLGASHVGTFCLTYVKMANSQEQSMYSAETILFAQFWHSEPLLAVRGVGALLKCKFPDVCQGLTLEAGLSKDRSQASCVNFFLYNTVSFYIS